MFRNASILPGWVAGELADLTGGLLASQPTGSATYLGHMYGTVLNNGAIYTASGVYQNVWNFDTDTGAVSLSNFDGLGGRSRARQPLLPMRVNSKQ